MSKPLPPISRLEDTMNKNTEIKAGDHRYLQGLPITIVDQPWQGTWYYVDGHVNLHTVNLQQMLPLTNPGEH